MVRDDPTKLPRRALLRVFAATAVTAAPTFAKASSFLRGAGEIRRLRLLAPLSGEEIDAAYFVDGEYIPEVLAEISHLFRDWRTDQKHPIDTRTLDILAATHRLLASDEPYNLLSGYRAPQNSGMHGSRTSWVAPYRRHATGQAADVRMRSRSVAQIAHAAASCHSGGVGRYLRSSFTHIDCGPVRIWDS